MERGDRVGELVQQRRVGAELVGVGVEAVERRVKDPRPEARLDDLRDQLEAAGQAVSSGYFACRPGAFVDLFQPLARLVGRERAPAEEAEQAGRRSRRSSRAIWSSASRRPAARRRCRRAGAGTAPGSRATGTSVRFASQRQGQGRLPTCKRRRIVAGLRAGRASRARPSQPVSRAPSFRAGRSPRSPSSGSATGRGWDSPTPCTTASRPSSSELGHLAHRRMQADLRR